LEELSPSELDLTMKTKKKNIGKLHPREKNHDDKTKIIIPHKQQRKT
jgi:hypothetical protein